MPLHALDFFVPQINTRRMDKLRAMAIFVRIVDEGSLTAAAGVLGMSVPSIVRTLAALEHALGVRLINRTTRRSSLTDAGREYYERSRRVMAEVEAADASLSARRTEAKGRLRVTAPVMYGRLRLGSVITDFLARHPGIEIELLLLDRVVDLVEEGIDVALRIAHLPESTLVAIPVGQTRRVVCAASRYIKRTGAPKTPSDLAAHRCIVFSGLAPGNEWLFAGKRTERVAVHPILRTNQFDVAIDACLQELGYGQFLCYQVEALLDAGKLKRVLTEFEPAFMPIHIVYPHARHVSATVRAFIDMAVPRLRSGPGTLRRR
jgi:DNA-binding transcriptional LysR family regulator